MGEGIELKKVLAVSIPIIFLISGIGIYLHYKPYLNLGNANMSYSLSKEGFSFEIKNPTDKMMKFPEMELKMYADDTLIGEGKTEKKEIKPNSKIRIPLKMNENQNLTLASFNQTTIKGNITLPIPFIRQEKSFEITKYENGSTKKIIDGKELNELGGPVG